MYAYGYLKSGPIETPGSIERFDLPAPTPAERDLLVAVEAVSVNPIDVKVRHRREAARARPVILGWDAVGVVQSVGSAVTQFAAGDRVWYAGELTRDGCNAELQLVDERLVSRAPQNLAPVDAVSLPLTSITAWELHHERLRFCSFQEGAVVSDPWLSSLRRECRVRL